MYDMKREIMLLARSNEVEIESKLFNIQVKKKTFEVLLVKLDIIGHINILKIKESLLDVLNEDYMKCDDEFMDCYLQSLENMEELSKLEDKEKFKDIYQRTSVLISKFILYEEILLSLLQEYEEIVDSIEKDYKIILLKIERFFKKKEMSYIEKSKYKKMKIEVRENHKYFRSTLDEKLLSIFERVDKKSKGYRPVITVRKCICKGCNLTIPPQLVNELQRFERIIFCPHCKRVLYWRKRQFCRAIG